MQAFIRYEDSVRYEEMLAWRTRPDKGVEYALYYVEADLESYREAVDEVETIIKCRITPIDDASAHVWACEEIRPETQAWREAFADRQLIVIPPVRFDDEAAMEMTIVGDGVDMHQMIENIPPPVDVTVNESGRTTAEVGRWLARSPTANSPPQKLHYGSVTIRFPAR